MTSSEASALGASTHNTVAIAERSKPCLAPNSRAIGLAVGGVVGVGELGT